MNIRRWGWAAGFAPALTVIVAVSSSWGAPVLPPPQFGRSVDIGLVSGIVIVKPAAGGSFRLGARDRNIPVGSELDTTHGEVDLRSARPPGGAPGAPDAMKPVQDGQFSAGVFRVLQRTSQGGLTVLDLVTRRNLRRACALGSEAKAPGRHLSSRVLATLNATDQGGSFRTRGRFSAATVRGTKWGTVDRCDGTLTIVRRGTVDVFDLELRKTIVVHAGHRYLARAPANGA